MKALLLEDDTEQFEDVSNALRKEFQQIEIQRISTESAFRRELEAVYLNPPDIIVIDVMLRWTDASFKYVPMPPEIRADNGHYRAGFRCAQMLAYDERTSKVPLIIYSVIDEGDLQAEMAKLGLNLRFIRKESYISNLAEEIKSALGNNRRRR